MKEPRPYRSLSYWHDTAGDDLVARPALEGDLEVDVAIIGGGFTGLWTARQLAEADPSVRVAIVEAEVCGFGASGRNGGWCSALLPSDEPEMAQAIRDTVDEVGRAAVEDGIDCHYVKGGTLSLVTNAAHERRIRAHAAPDDIWLDGAEARARFDASGVTGASFTPDSAAIHPARLARGLAEAVERRGVAIYEQTRAIEIVPGRVHTDGGTIRAEAILRCTEGYTPSLRGEQRTMVPLYSLMIATEPLPDAVWDEIGLHDRETFTDGRHLLIYGQRTADGRFAFGGRGAPYHFGSSIRPGYDLDPKVFDALERELRILVPQMGDAAITHRWGGALGVPRNWRASVGFDRISGLGWAGGYVGDGVATTNLAGRTLADLVLGRDTDLTHLPWVGHLSRKWEPEPIRWVGINATRAIAASADRNEARTGREDRLRARVMEWLMG